MENIKVSLIVSMYKGERYIRECLDSIINQSHQNLEILLVDDGSPDACGSIADNYAKCDSRIKVIHQKNSGVSRSRNNALAIATGKYICIVDQDDVLSESYVAYLLNLCESYDTEISLTPDVDKFFDRQSADEKLDSIKVISGEEAVEEMLFHKYVIAPWNKMIKRSLITDAHIQFNPNFFNGEGFAFSIECFQTARRVAVGSRKIYHYRVGDPKTGASTYKESYIKSSLNAQQYIKSILLAPSKELLEAWKFSNWHTHCDCFNIMVGCAATKKSPELYRTLKQVCRSEALCALKAPVSSQQKLRGVLFRIHPVLAARIINAFRVRKFEKVKD